MRNTKMAIKEIDLGRKQDDVPKATDVVALMEERNPTLMNEFRKIQQEQYELFAQKQMAYGRGNIMLGGDIEHPEDRIAAIRGITIRLNDKMQRLLNLVLKGIANPLSNESVTDTFMDMSIYGIISMIVERGRWK